MPNWTSNKLTLQGSKEDLQHFLDNCCTDGCIDFEKIIPFPEGFDRDLVSGSDDLAYDVVYGDWKARAYPWVQELIDGASMDREKVIAVYAARYEQRTDEYRRFRTYQELADAYKRNVDLTGHKTWYEWCCANWGTKWNAKTWDRSNSIEHDLEDDLQEHEVAMRFDTAWYEPLPVFERIHELYPRLMIKYVAEHEGDDSITGRKWYPEEDE